MYLILDVFNEALVFSRGPGNLSIRQERQCCFTDFVKRFLISKLLIQMPTSTKLGLLRPATVVNLARLSAPSNVTHCTPPQGHKHRYLDSPKK